MQNGVRTFIGYFLMLLSAGLMTLVIIDLVNTFNYWRELEPNNSTEFATCIQYPLSTRTVFAFFGLIAASSLMITSVWIFFDILYFIAKILMPLALVIAFVFGPVMLFFTILAFANWDGVMHYCSNGEVYVSVSNIIAVIICFILGLLITIGSSVFSVFLLLLDSILYKEDGSKFIGKMFWSAVQKKRAQEDTYIIQARLNHFQNN